MWTVTKDHQMQIIIQETCYIVGRRRTFCYSLFGKWGVVNNLSKRITKIYLRSDTVGLCLSKPNSMAATDDGLVSWINL